MLPSTSAIPCDGSGGPEDAESSSADVERKQRKKLQNRLNQRARRDRIKEGKGKAGKPSSKFETSRWRIDEFEFFEAPRSRHVARKSNDNDDDNDQIKSDSQLILPNMPILQLPSVFHSLSLAQVDKCAPHLGRWAGSQSGMPGASPRSDHLLSLVNYNTFRGMFINKVLLATLSQHFPWGGNVAVNILEGLPGQTTIVPSSDAIPASLIPTQQQMTKLHATWIDFIPFPQMRDNLIRHHEVFDHWQFIRDMVGDLLDELFFLRPSPKTSPPGAHQTTLYDGMDDELTKTRNGLIIWGDPHRQDSWEATPGFLKKWWWVVDGSEEIIKSTNYWRSLRHEEPIRVVANTHKEQSAGQISSVE